MTRAVGHERDGGRASGPGTVVLEVGAGVGALVLYTPAGLDGAEIEISPDGAARRTHSRVRPRHTAAGTSYAAVYPGLAAGRYTIWRNQGEPSIAVTVTAGQVTSYCWGTSTALPPAV